MLTTMLQQNQDFDGLSSTTEQGFSLWQNRPPHLNNFGGHLAPWVFFKQNLSQQVTYILRAFQQPLSHIPYEIQCVHFIRWEIPHTSKYIWYMKQSSPMKIATCRRVSYLVLHAFILALFVVQLNSRIVEKVLCLIFTSLGYPNILITLLWLMCLQQASAPNTRVGT